MQARIRACFESPDDLGVLTTFDQAFRPLMMAILASLDKDEAEDAYQSAFVKYIQIFRSGQVPSNPEAYFVAIAKNCLIDAKRKAKRVLLIDRDLNDVGHRGSDDPTAASDERMALLGAIAQLDRRCQFIIEAYYVRELPSPELASRLGIAPESVHMAIKRCRDRLGAILGR